MWYVIQVPTGKEELTKDLCIDKIDSVHYNDIFILRYAKKVKERGRWKEVIKTLFPGYIFVDTDDIMSVRQSLKGIRAMTIVLGSDGEPIPVSGEERSFLQSLIDDDYVVRMSSGFIIGDAIALVNGPLRNTRGVIKRIDRHKRQAVIDVELFGGVTKATVGLEVIKKVTGEEFDRIQAEKENEYAGSGEQADVKVLSGVFRGMTGKLITPADKLDGADEVDIELMIFGAPSKVSVTIDSVLIKDVL
ncbi:MAG: antiterminator LoaP [Lachnospiraceae bacterium]|nr:antiterminator LoaP [Lachnospiraceae bacterium]